MKITKKDRLQYQIGAKDLKDEKVEKHWNRYLKMNNYSFCFPNFLYDAFYMKNLSREKDDSRSMCKLNIDLDPSLRSIETNSKACESIFDKVITIRVKPNNTFCTLRSLFHNQMISASSTKYGVKMSKKSLKYNYKIVLKAFLKEVDTFTKSNRVLFSITAPKKIRRELIRILKMSMEPMKSDKIPTLDKAEHQPKVYDHGKDSKGSAFAVFKLNAKKCFNGCRVRKKKRKKQRGQRIYK
jgi:ribosomal protein S11